MNNFFMVFVEGERSPVCKHETIIQAEQEAQRLSRATGKKAYVLCPLKSFHAVESFVIEDCRPKNSNLPF